MITHARLIGLTPYWLRLGAYYACLGIGEYTPKGYAQFDRVVVKICMPWRCVEEAITRSMVVLRVDFMRGDVVGKYVEYAISPAGWGGKSLLTVVQEPPSPTGDEPDNSDDPSHNPGG